MHTTTSLLTALAGAALVLASPAPAPPAPLITAHPLGPFPGGLFARQDAIPTTTTAATTTPSDDSDDAKITSCFKEYNDFGWSLPTPNSQLAEWLSTAMSTIMLDESNILSSVDQICNAASNTLTPPASLSSAWSRYQSASASWIDANAPAVSSLQSACPGEVSALANHLIMSDEAACTRAVVDVVEWLVPQTDAPGGKGGAGGGDGDGNGEAGKAGNDNAGEGEGDSEGQDAGDGDGNADGDNTPTPTESTAGVAAARETGLVAAVAAVAVGIAGVVAIL